MATSDNILQAVQTYQMSGLAYLQNSYCLISNANTKFKDFNKIEANLGTTVTFDKPPRFTTTNSLVASFEALEQRVQSLTVDQAINTSFVVSAQQRIFNVDGDAGIKNYMDVFGRNAIAEIGSKIEANVALNCETGPYRFYGDGVTPINSFNQLAQALALFRNFGSAQGMAKGILSDVIVPGIVGSGLNQFAPSRNDDLANSWELGRFSNCEWYESNLLPIHTAGSEGIAGSTLTVVSVTKDSDDAVTSITFSGCSAASDADSVKQYDRFQFDDGVSGQTNLRFRTFVGHEVSASPVQFMATADAASTGGSQVTVSITPGLKASAGKNQNINTEIVAGMQCKVMPSHRVGMIYSGDPLYLAMPMLPEETPFPTANKADPDSGVSLRQYYGSLFGQNQRGMIIDAIWGSTFIPEYGLALLFPL